MSTRPRNAFPILTCSALVLILAAPAFAADGAGGARQNTPMGQQDRAQQRDTMQQQDQMRQGSRAGQGQQEQGGMQARNMLMEMRAGEISGHELYSAQGQSLGKIKQIARNKEDGSLSAVVSMGGFLGFGATDVAIPLDRISKEGERFVATTGMSSSELKRQWAYEANRYQPVGKDMVIGEGAMGAPQAAKRMLSFRDLDRNGDGYISVEEAQGNDLLVGRWRFLDVNNDNRLDRAEFSAFEEEVSPNDTGTDSMR